MMTAADGAMRKFVFETSSRTLSQIRMAAHLEHRVRRGDIFEKFA